MIENWENNGTEEIGLVTPTPDLQYIVFSCGLLQVNFTHILQGYFTGTRAITWLP